MTKARLTILRQVAKGEISVEEAEVILKKFDTEVLRDLCDKCLYNSDFLDSDEGEKTFLH